MAQDCKDSIFRGGQAGFDAGAAELQMGIAFVEMPGDAGAEWRRRAQSVRRGSCGIFLRRIAGMRIEHQQNAEIIFAGKFADHQ